MAGYNVGDNPDPKLFESLVIGGQSYGNSEFEYRGNTWIKQGSDPARMLIFKIKNNGTCLLLPDLNAISEWEQYSASLKEKLEKLQALNFRIQHYEFVDATLQTSNDSKCLRVILAEDFEATCNTNPLIIFNGRENSSEGEGKYGSFPEQTSFQNILENSKDPDFVQTLFEQLVKEYAIAYMLQFNLTGVPSDSAYSAVGFEFVTKSDSLNTIHNALLDFGIPNVLNTIIAEYYEEIPRVRYMAWDLIRRKGYMSYLSDFSFTLRYIGTLEDFNRLKKGISLLVEMVAIAVTFFTYREDGRSHGEAFLTDSSLQPSLTKNFREALDDAFLTKALKDAAVKVEELTGQVALNSSLFEPLPAELAPPQPWPLNEEVLIRLANFNTYLNKYYKKSHSSTVEFIEQAKKICDEGLPQESQDNYNTRVCEAIAQLAAQHFTHRTPAIFRVLADLVFIPLGVLTLGLAFGVKYCLTESPTFFIGKTKTHRQEKLKEILDTGSDYGLNFAGG